MGLDWSSSVRTGSHFGKCMGAPAWSPWQSCSSTQALVKNYVTLVKISQRNEWKEENEIKEYICEQW